MRNRYGFIALLLTISLLFAGCEAAPSGGDATPTTGADTATTTEANTTTTSITTGTTTLLTGEITEEDFTLLVGDLKVCLGDEANPLLNALGEPAQVEDPPSGGLWSEDYRAYMYDGLSVGAPVVDGTEYIYNIQIKSKNYPTRRGITLGCTREDIREAYGTPTIEDHSQMIYIMTAGRDTVNGEERDVEHTLYFSFFSTTVEETVQHISLTTDYFQW